jgi:hypothetical protein
MSEPVGAREVPKSGAYPNLPPLPWSYTANVPAGRHEGSGFVYLHDAGGRRIGTVWGKPDEKLAVARFIADAAALGQTLVPPDGQDAYAGLPPRPWFYTTSAPADQHEGKGTIYLNDAKGRKIGTVWGGPDQKLASIQFITDLSDGVTSPALEAAE